MLYHRPYPIEFNHCDPAGIVFYPRYFEMTNHVCENFFREIVGVSYAQMMAARSGVPTARLECDFHAPSRLGEVLEVTLAVTALGRSSLGVEIRALCGGEARLTARLTLVRVVEAEGIRPDPWPEEMRARLAAFQSA